MAVEISAVCTTQNPERHIVWRVERRMEWCDDALAIFFATFLSCCDSTIKEFRVVCVVFFFFVCASPSCVVRVYLLCGEYVLQSVSYRQHTRRPGLFCWRAPCGRRRAFASLFARVLESRAHAVFRDIYTIYYIYVVHWREYMYVYILYMGLWLWPRVLYHKASKLTIHIHLHKHFMCVHI